MATKHKGKVRRIVVEPSDNGGFISRTERERTPGDVKAGVYEDRDEKNVHPNVEHLAGHIRQAFGGGASTKSKKKAGKKGGGPSDLARDMLSERC
jgi:hypothetical protein